MNGTHSYETSFLQHRELTVPDITASQCLRAEMMDSRQWRARLSQLNSEWLTLVMSVCTKQVWLTHQTGSNLTSPIMSLVTPHTPLLSLAACWNCDKLSFIIFHSLDTFTMYCDQPTLLKWIFHRWDYRTLTQQQTVAYTTPSHPTSSQQTSAQAHTMYVLLHSTKSHHITGVCFHITGVCLVTHRHTASDALQTTDWQWLECCDQHWASGLPDTFQDLPSGINNIQTIQYDMIWYWKAECGQLKLAHVTRNRKKTLKNILKQIN